jgi:hypothetical protein
VYEADFRFCPDCGLEVSRDVHDAVPPPADDQLARLSERIPTTLAHKIRASRGVIEGERNRRDAERTTRRCFRLLERLGHRVTLTPAEVAA